MMDFPMSWDDIRSGKPVKPTCYRHNNIKMDYSDINCKKVIIYLLTLLCEKHAGGLSDDTIN